jgi:hypothetical protein
VQRFGDLGRTAYVEYPGEGETLIAEWELGFSRERRHVYVMDTAVYTALVLEPHAVARILQRKQQLDADTIHSELRPVVGGLTVLASAVAQLKHLQFAMPTPSGLIAGVVEYDGEVGLLRGKTFMTQLSPERVRLRDALLPLVQGVRVSPTYAHADFLAKRRVLVEALRSHEWLAQPLMARRDREQERWSRAPSRTGD